MLAARLTRAATSTCSRIEPTVDHAPREEVRLRRTLRGLGLFVDLVVVSAADAERLRADPSNVVGRALAEGRAIAT